MKAERKDQTLKWLGIIKRFIYLYHPSILSLNDVYRINIRLCLNEGVNERNIDKYYLCPLCLTNYVFVENEEIFANEQFDFDHFPPKSVGGRESILVCKTCNSGYGGDMDFSLKQYLQSSAFINKGNGASHPINFIMSGTKGRYKSSLQWKDESLVMDLGDFKKYPLLAKGFKDHYLKKEGFNLNFKFFMPSQKLIQQALLKAAYLKCFSVFGYEFCYSIIGRNIIQVLKNSLVHPLNNMGVCHIASTDVKPNGLYFIESPEKCQAYIYGCSISEKTIKYSSNIFIIIPKFEKNAWANMSNLNNLIEQREESFILRKIDNCITNREYLGYSKNSRII